MKQHLNFKLPYFNDVLFRYLDELSPVKPEESQRVVVA